MHTKSIVIASLAVAAAELLAVPADPLTRFWRENDGKTVRRLPVDVVPENAFWGFGTRDFLDGMKAFNRMADEGFAKSTYNCITLTLRCNPELGDAETMAAAKAFFAKARAAGVKVYMDTDPRIARREFFARWPNERQGIAYVATAAPTNGVASFSHTFNDATDHMTGGAKSSYRPLAARVVDAFAARRRTDGSLDLARRRPVDVTPNVALHEHRAESGGGYMDRASAIVTGKKGEPVHNPVLLSGKYWQDEKFVNTLAKRLSERKALVITSMAGAKVNVSLQLSILGIEVNPMVIPAGLGWNF